MLPFALLLLFSAIGWLAIVVVFTLTLSAGIAVLCLERLGPSPCGLSRLTYLWSMLHSVRTHRTGTGQSQYSRSSHLRTCLRIRQGPHHAICTVSNAPGHVH